MLESYTPQIEALLYAYTKNKIQDSRVIGESVTQLWQEIDEYLHGGGKRLRPRIFLMIYDFYNGLDTSSALQAACAWELLHASLLIHDDIIDRETVRHGKPNIAGKYKQRYAQLTNSDADHYALSAALLAGDLLLSSAFDIVSQSGLTDIQKIAMHRYLYRAIFTVGGGELLDTESALYPIDSVDPYAVATYKTASYSFMLPMQSGAALAGSPSAEIDKLGEIGRFAGIAFQLKDDLLGVFGDSQTTGKSNRSDLLEKKRTLLIQRALSSTPSEEAERLRELYSSHDTLTGEQAEEIYQIIVATPAKTEIETLVESNTQSALNLVDALETGEANRELLAGLITGLTGRHS